MYDCAYGSYSSLSRRDSVNMSGCAYGSSGPICQVMSIAMAFLFLVRVELENSVQADSCWGGCQFHQVIGPGHGRCRFQYGCQGNGQYEH